MSYKIGIRTRQDPGLAYDDRRFTDAGVAHDHGVAMLMNQPEIIDFGVHLSDDQPNC